MKYLYALCMIYLISTSINTQSKANTVTYANTSLSNLISPTTINQSLLVDKDNTHNIGSITKGWKNLYLDTAVYLNGLRFLACQPGTGTANTAVGSNALYSNTSGSYNTGIGYNALYNNDDGASNIGIGYKALSANTSGDENVAIGVSTLFSNIDGYDNVAVGRHAMYFNTTGYDNTAIGTQALGYNNGVYNTATGFQALYVNTTGSVNTANGSSALSYNTTGNANTANGVGALRDNTSGSDNSAYGFNTGGLITSGTENTFIGSTSDCGSNGKLNNSMALGYDVTVTSSNHVVVGNSSVTSIGGYVNWSNVSDGRIKKNIKSNVPGLAFINKLNPVTYNLDLDAANNIINPTVIKDKIVTNIQSSIDADARKAKEQIVYTGFVAQDVEKAAQSLHYDFSGVDKPGDANTLYGLRYSDFVVPLVKAVQELSKQNDSLKNEINTKLTAQQNEIDELKLMLGIKQAVAVSLASLQQNIPNPFSNSTSISYNIPQQFSSAR